MTPFFSSLDIGGFGVVRAVLEGVRSFRGFIRAFGKKGNVGFLGER